MNYGWACTECKLFKIFGSKCYILKDNRNGKFDC